MVIDELIVIESGEQKFVDSADNTIIDVINYDGIDYHFAEENEATNGICNNAVAEPIIDMRVSGNSIQDGTPTPESPIEIQSVGDYDEVTGKYRIPLKINGTIINLYLNEPLRKTGDYADYIDYKNKKVVRQVGEKRLKGTDGNWSSTVAWGTHAFFIPNLTNMLSWGTTKGALSSHLQSYTGTNTTALSNQWVIGGSNIVLVNDNCLTSAELKTWLNENEFKIIYPLETPIEEAIDIPTIETIKGTNVFGIETTIKPSSLIIDYWKQIMPYEEIVDNIIQTGSNILIISTGAEITQSGTNLTIGG